MKYLETNSIRAFAPRLKDDLFTKDKFTSILTILELLSGIEDESSFKIRKSVLREIKKSKIRIVNWFPEIVIFNAFGFDLLDNDVTSKVFKIVSIIDYSVNFGEFLANINENELLEIWEFLLKYDESASSGFIAAVHEKFEKSDVKLLIKEFNDRWNTDSLLDIKIKIVQFFAEILLKIYPRKVERNLSEVILFYDHSIDIYLISITFYINEKISFNNYVGNNDYIDLSHLVYLKSNFNQIVTNDKLILKVMNNFFPSNILKISDI